MSTMSCVSPVMTPTTRSFASDEESLLSSGSSRCGFACEIECNRDVPELLMALLEHVPEQIANASTDLLAERLSRLQKCLKPQFNHSGLKMGNLDMGVVRSLCAEGVPNEVPALRAALWKVLLGYLPEDLKKWDRVLSRARATYAEFVRDLETDVKESCHEEGARTPGSLRAILDQVSKDVTRTRTELGFFDSRLDGAIDENTELVYGPCNVTEPQYHYDVLARVLLLFAKLNNGVKYAQGMNELCAPLYYLFSQDPLCGQHAEADTFFCFNLLMADMQDVFVENLNETGKGMLGRMEKCSQILKENDSQLWEHLNGQNVEPVLYNARWIMSMLTQDLVMPDVLRVWDTLLGNLGGPKPLLHDLCVARVILIRDHILASDDGECVRLLQRGGYPAVSIEDFLLLGAHLHRNSTDNKRRRPSDPCGKHASLFSGSNSTTLKSMSIASWMRSPRTTPRGNTPRTTPRGIRTPRVVSTPPRRTTPR